MSEVFENNSDFGKWLESNYWFQDGYLLDYKVEDSKNIIYLKLAYQIEGTYEANTERTLKVFSLKAEGVSNNTELEEGEWSKGHCMEGLDIKDSRIILFTLDVPKPVEIECGSVTITQEPNKIEHVDPWLSEIEIFISVQGEKLPTPAEWLQWFSVQGHRLGWRYYSGEQKEASAIPQREYDVWYLQTVDQIPQTSQGLFFRNCKDNGWSFDISFQRTELSDDVWCSLKQMILRFKNIEIRSGNCKFNNEQWRNSVVG